MHELFAPRKRLIVLARTLFRYTSTFLSFFHNDDDISNDHKPSTHSRHFMHLFLPKRNIMEKQSHPQITRLAKRKRGFSPPPAKLIASYIFVGATCFYSGLMIGAPNSNPTDCVAQAEARGPDVVSSLQLKISQQDRRINALNEQLKKTLENPPANNVEPPDDTAPRFPPTIRDFMGGMATVDRNAFMDRFDIGVPIQKNGRGNEEVLLLYAHSDALPLSDPYKAVEAKSNTKIPNFGTEVDTATENCDTLNMILLQPGERTQCYAMVGQFRGFHIQKFMRLPESGPLDRNEPLRLVNRGAQASGRLSARVPRTDQTEEYWKILSAYLQNLNSTLTELKPYAEKAAVNNTVVVMVCEFDFLYLKELYRILYSQLVAFYSFVVIRQPWTIRIINELCMLGTGKGIRFVFGPSICDR